MHGAFDEVRNSLVRHWGEMSGYWGINRTMAEIHALLFISTEPLCTDDVMQQLQISRGNASMNLRGLVDWGLIRRVHKLGDRKEYFQADTDIWHMFETIMRERRRREVEPIVATIDRCLQVMEGPAPADADPVRIAECRKRLEHLRAFLAGMSRLFEAVLKVGGASITDLLRLIDAPPPPAAGSPGPRAQSLPGRRPGGAAPNERTPEEPPRRAGTPRNAGQSPPPPAGASNPPNANSSDRAGGKARPRPAKASRAPVKPKPPAYKRRPR
ncbi:MAG: hypothetical protein IPM64_09565 [Phycisphaerales bacterium]|nr:hypothetical protein [Phycisphaerales bacterium]